MTPIMCGICGWVSWTRPPDPNIVSTMTDRLLHRGPDAGAVVTLNNAVLGHRRLSVIDTDAQANQPMADSSASNWIVYNGETYNFQELRAELSAKGVRFKTRSDTEVVVEAFRAWGPDCVRRFNGMFALAVWDSENKVLFLARDRLGKKPLFWSRTADGDVVFASEIKALLAHPQIGRDPNPAAISQFLSLNYVLSSTPMFEGVHLLPPGSYIVADGSSNPSPVQYWDLAGAFHNKRTFKSDQAAAEELRSLVDDAVACRLVSDVPVGIFLSGGIDSSAIAASVRARCSTEIPHSFSIAFKEKSYNEAEEARAVAAHLNIPHHDRTVEVDPENSLARMVYYADTPFADTSFYPMYHLAEFARQHVTVALSGDGGDELFGGYETYNADRMRATAQFLPNSLMKAMSQVVDVLLPVSFDKVSLDYKVRKFLRGMHMDSDSAHYFWRTIFEPEEKTRLIRKDRQSEAGEDGKLAFLAHAAAVGDCHPLDRAMYTDIKTWLADDILLKLDRSTMAHSLEARTPLLDYRLAEFAASLPVDMKLRRLTKKYMLKISQKGRIPNWVLTRPKKGFNAPVSHWLSGQMKDMARDMTRDRVLEDWIELDMVDTLWKAHETKKSDNGLKLLGIMNLSIWLRQIREGVHFSPLCAAAPTRMLSAPLSN